MSIDIKLQSYDILGGSSLIRSMSPSVAIRNNLLNGIQSVSLFQPFPKQPDPVQSRNGNLDIVINSARGPIDQLDTVGN